MIIVGVGAGPGMLTLEAIKALGEASLIYGSQRSIDLVRDHIPPGCTVKIIKDYKKLRELPEQALVLSTGDPMLSGLGYLGGQGHPGNIQPASGLRSPQDQSAEDGSHNSARPEPGP